MRHGEGKEHAHDLYVHQHMTFDEIAKRLNRSDKTIRSWADADGWREERDRLFDYRKNTHEKLHKVVDMIAERILTDVQDGNETPPSVYFALNKLAVTMKNLYNYEGGIEDDQQTTGQKEKTTPEEIARRVREVLGG